MRQQDFLRDVIKRMSLTRRQFALRIGCSERTLDKWLLPDNSSDHAPMNRTAWLLLEEILLTEDLKIELAQVKAMLQKIQNSKN